MVNLWQEMSFGLFISFVFVSKFVSLFVSVFAFVFVFVFVLIAGGWWDLARGQSSCWKQVSPSPPSAAAAAK